MNALIGQLSIKRKELIEQQQQLVQQFQQKQQEAMDAKSGVERIEGALILINQLITEEEAKEKSSSPAVPPDGGLPVIDIDDLEILGAGHGSV